MKLGANSVLFGGHDMATAFRCIKMAGYDGIEVSAMRLERFSYHGLAEYANLIRQYRRIVTREITTRLPPLLRHLHQQVHIFPPFFHLLCTLNQYQPAVYVRIHINGVFSGGFQKVYHLCVDLGRKRLLVKLLVVDVPRILA